MNISFSKFLLFSMAIAAMLFTGTATATNGYLTHGVGTKNKSMAGAGTALPQDAIDVANNPAGAAVIGKHREVGLSFFSPDRSYTSSASLAKAS